jgi:6-phosphogluconolactonase
MDETTLKIEVYPDAKSAARAAAAFIAGEARTVIAARGRCVLAVSGGSTPWIMLRELTGENLQWDAMHIVQVDERVAPVGDPDRNLTHLQEGLLKHAPLRSQQIHAMPVDSPDLEGAVAQYVRTLSEIAGSPPVLDLVHLGLGPDGHTASLVPGDGVLDIKDGDVALTGIYQGRRRMTLTFPILNRARRVLWLVTGPEKTHALARLRSGDPSIPAARIRRDGAYVFADRSARGKTPGIPTV